MTDLPGGWTEATVGDLFHYVRGVTYSKADATKIDETDRLPVLRANNFNRTFDLTDLVFLPTELINKEQRLRAADLLFAMSSGSKSHVGKCILVKREMNAGFGAFCGVLRPLDKTFSELFYHAFKSKIFRNYIEELAAGTNINNLKRDRLLDYKIPLPPLNEQRRIVEKIEAIFDEIDKGVESLQTARTTLGLYRQSLLKSAFKGRLTADWRAQNADKLEAPQTLLARIQRERDTRYKAALDAWQDALAQWRAGGEKGKKPAKPRRQTEPNLEEDWGNDLPALPGNARWVACNQVSGQISDGTHKTPKYCDSGIHFISAKDIRNFQIDFSDTRFVDEAQHLEMSKRCLIEEGNVLITKSGTIGRVAVVQTRKPFSLFESVANIPVLDPMDSKFVAYVASFVANSFFIGKAQKGVAVRHLHLEDIRKMPIPLFSIHEQAEIVHRLNARLEAADALEAEIDAALTRANALRQSILKKAFSGHLVPQDPNDEPAAALLERIKADRAMTPRTKKRKTTHA